MLSRTGTAHTLMEQASPIGQSFMFAHAFGIILFSIRTMAVPFPSTRTGAETLPAMSTVAAITGAPRPFGSVHATRKVPLPFQATAGGVAFTGALLGRRTFVLRVRSLRSLPLASFTQAPAVSRSAAWIRYGVPDQSSHASSA